MRRAVMSAALLVVALVLQLTVVNRLPLPGAGTPDLVLLIVVALGLFSGPAAGALTGFCAGLALDLAPPASYLIGQYALVFCVIGYLCGRMRPMRERSALLTIVAAMAAAALGEALYAALGLALHDPQITLPAVRQVLPSSVLYDVLLTPFLLYLTVRAMNWAQAVGRDDAGGSRADGARLLARVRAARPALPGAAGLGGAAGPLGGAGLLGGAGWLSGPLGSRRGRRGRQPRLRPGSGTPGSSAAARAPHGMPPRPVNLQLGPRRRRDGAIGGTLGRSGYGLAGQSSLRGRRGPSGAAFRGTGASALSGRSPRRYRTGPPGSAFRPGSRGPSGSAFRQGSRGPSGSAFRQGSRGPSGSAFRHGGPGAGRAILTGSGAPPRSPRFRPDGRMHGGSAAIALRPTLHQRPVMLRFGGSRRGDGLIGGGMLGGALGMRAHRGLAGRPVRLRLGSARRGDGMLGGLASSRRYRPGSRRAAPRFRTGLGGGVSLGGGRAGLRAGRQARFRFRRSMFLATWTGGRLGGRSRVWRINTRRTGGLS
jgi:rod shape-determining protein MreD